MRILCPLSDADDALCADYFQIRRSHSPAMRREREPVVGNAGGLLSYGLDAEITSPNSLQVVPSNFINCICLIGAKLSALVDTVKPGSGIGSFKS
jgi:hypothetical protein